MGRGYLLPIGVAILMMMLMNLVLILGWGEFFPWTVPILLAEGKEPMPLFSYAVLLLTGLAGVLGTYVWWKYADQNR